MNEKTPLYAPSLYWFAYQYHEGRVIAAEATGDRTSLRISPQWVKSQYEKILTAFDVDLEFTIREAKPGRNFDLLENTDPENIRKVADFTTKDEKLAGFIYPQSLHDSYALNLNIYCPENYEQDKYQIADLAKLNPSGCFNPPSKPILGYMGQTLFLSAYLSQGLPENINDLEHLAKQCWLSFFNLENSEPEIFPALYRASNLFGGYLYEYGNPKVTQTENPYGHLLIWFLFEESPTRILQDCYWELPELLLYYHKITKTFQDSRVVYAIADEIVAKNQIELNQFNQNYLERENVATLSGDDLQTLKTTLKKLLKTSLGYSQQLRNLEYAQNTIAINTKNYQAQLEHMAQVVQTPLDNFQIFAAKEAVAFQDQIKADLNYFKQGYILLDTAISTIRGLVEIDQAQRDRQRQEAEKERERQEVERDRQIQANNQRLQDHFQAIGVGIAAGAIVASTSGLIFQGEITYPWQENHGKQLHPFTIGVLLSVACAVVFWFVCLAILKCRRK